MRTRRSGRAPGDVAVGAEARLLVGPDDVWIAAAGGHLEVLRWAREHHCPWDERTCGLPLGAGTLGCCSGRGRTTADVMSRLANPPQRAGTWKC